MTGNIFANLRISETNANSISGGEASNAISISGGEASNAESISGGEALNAEASNARSISGGEVSNARSISGGEASNARSISGGEASNAEFISGGEASNAEFISGGEASNAEFISGGEASNAESISGGEDSNTSSISENEPANTASTSRNRSPIIIVVHTLPNFNQTERNENRSARTQTVNQRPIFQRFRMRQIPNFCSDFSLMFENARRNIIPVVVELTEELESLSYSVSEQEVKNLIIAIGILYLATKKFIDKVLPIAINEVNVSLLESSVDRFRFELERKTRDFIQAFNDWQTCMRNLPC